MCVALHIRWKSPQPVFIHVNRKLNKNIVLIKAEFLNPIQFNFFDNRGLLSRIVLLMINTDRNYLENKVLHRSYILSVLLYKIYPQVVEICEISVSNKNHSYVTVQQLHSNKHQYCILKNKKSNWGKSFEVCILSVQQKPLTLNPLRLPVCFNNLNLPYLQ